MALGRRASALGWGAAVLAAALAVPGCRAKRERVARRGDAAAVVILPTAGEEAGDLPLVPEREPNDDPARPQPLAFTGDAGVAGVSGTGAAAGKGRDLDVFRIAVPADGADGGSRSVRLALDLRGEAPLPALQVTDGAGRALASLPGGSADRDGLPNVTVQPGATYLLRVRPSSKRPDGGLPVYRLSARVLPFELGDEREPNGTAAEAMELERAESGTEAAGFLGGRRDEDWYRIPLSGIAGPASLSAEVEAVEGVSVVVAIHDIAGKRISSARAGRSQRVALRRVPVPIGAPGGHAFVVVRAESGTNLDQRYLLRVLAEVREEPEGSTAQP